jgi:gliding motility-associated protein GldM
MSIPKEPRQLMINLMYLVLTAMLAINVSSEILRAFSIINKSINTSNNNLGGKNQGTIENFEAALLEKKVMEDLPKKKRIEEALVRAKEVSKLSSEVCANILGYKAEIIQQSGGYILDPKSGDSVLKAESNLDAATVVMIEKAKRGPKMKKELEEFKSKIVGLAANPSDSTSVLYTKGLDSILPITFDYGTKSGTGTDEDWALNNFHMVPTIGATTILDKYINDVKSSENIVLDQIWAEAFGEKIKPPIVFNIVNAFKLLNSPENTYLLPGEKYKSTIVIGSYNTSNTQSVYIAVNNSPVKIVDGVGTFETTVDNKPGEHTLIIKGKIYDPNIKKDVEVKQIEAKYFVGTPAATISLDKMNVFYIGVDNPITVSASGVKMENISITSSSNISITPGATKGSYIVRASAGQKEGTIKISGKRNDGLGSEDFGTRTYRIKTIPDPVIRYMGKNPGTMVAGLAKVGLGPEAVLENFDFECKFNVVSYTVTTIVRGEEQNYEIKNSWLIKSNPSAAKAVNSLKAKDQLLFENIVVVGCDGKPRKMGTITYKLVP